MSKRLPFDSTVSGTAVVLIFALVGCQMSPDRDAGNPGPTGNGADAVDDVDGDIGGEQPNQCGSSLDRNLANLAASSAEELGRWEATKDFEVGADGRTLQLSKEGEARCTGDCAIVRATLALQEPASAVVVGHDPAAFAGVLVAGWERQKLAEASRAASPPGHELTRIAIEPAACGALFWFDAREAGCGGDCPYPELETLATQLVFAGYPENPYLQFQTATDFMGKPASLVAVDPSGYMIAGSGMNTPTCIGADIWYDPTREIGGHCCVRSSGLVGFFQHASWSPTTFLCV